MFPIKQSEKKRLLFRCDGATLPEIGTGHVVRDLAVADALVERGVCRNDEIGFVVRGRGPFHIGRRMVEQSGYVVEQVCDEDLEWNSEREANVLMRLGASVLIVDRLATKADWMTLLTTRSHKVVTMDDIGSGALLADIVINGILHDLPPGEGRYLGYDYLYLDAGERGEPKESLRVDRIVASFGGHDERDLTGFFLESLLNNRSLLQSDPPILELLVGSESDEVLSRWRKQIARLIAQGWREARLLVRTPDYYHRLAKADLAVVSGGLTVFESVVLGVPVIGLPQYTHQLITLQQLAGNGAVMLGCTSMVLDQSYFTTAFDRMMASMVDRSNRVQRGLELIDGKGKERVLKILSLLLCRS